MEPEFQSNSCGATPATFQADLLPKFSLRGVLATNVSDNSEPDYVIKTRAGRGIIAALISSQVIKVYTTDGPAPSFSNTIPEQMSPITDIYLPLAHPNVLVASSRDGHVHLFDMRAKAQAMDIIANQKSPLFCCCMNAIRIAAGGHTDIDVWDLRATQQQCIQVEHKGALTHHTEDIMQLEFHPNRDTLWSGAEDGMVVEYNFAAKSKHELYPTAWQVDQSIARFGFFGPENENVYCLTQFQTLSLWRIKNSHKVADYGNIRETLTSITPQSPCDYLIDCHYDHSSGRLFLSAGSFSGDLQFHHLNRDSVQPVCILSDGHKDVIRDVIWQPQNQRIMSAGEDGKICTWSCAPEDQQPLAHNTSNQTSGPIKEHTFSQKRKKKFNPY